MPTIATSRGRRRRLVRATRSGSGSGRQDVGAAGDELAVQLGDRRRRSSRSAATWPIMNIPRDHWSSPSSATSLGASGPRRSADCGGGERRRRVIARLQRRLQPRLHLAV